MGVATHQVVINISHRQVIEVLPGHILLTVEFLDCHLDVSLLHVVAEKDQLWRNRYQLQCLHFVESSRRLDRSDDVLVGLPNDQVNRDVVPCPVHILYDFLFHLCGQTIVLLIDHSVKSEIFLHLAKDVGLLFRSGVRPATSGAGICELFEAALFIEFLVFLILKPKLLERVDQLAHRVSVNLLAKASR